MSREKAKEILYKHEEKSGGAINHWQAQWILDAMIEYNESIVKSNIVLGNVMPCELELKASLTLLRDLADIQNDAPLEQDREQWTEIMESTYEFLDAHEA